ncbi:hypothetical protein [Psychrobacillus lasiicapitis]|uniref:Uncharacterized protein n=1 Tax=Psychrobacillus lasiicapitis TaxID=1636719 RepID=A0A544T1D9_9BACI|nr:hypothetical protein [Psychrobacillus lasiicapitis]TQR11273.1 hypothetical protein FG382_15055 [Psychrobacillus lasiicapitis]GGA41913.1 hypothetical protein GCM10011384_34570 [Psychrobacillus lasiicapitis]
MSNFGILSILPILGLLFIIWRLLRLTKSTSNRINWAQRSNKWILCIYVGVLLLAVVVYEAIQADGEKVYTQKEYATFIDENNVFQQAFEKNEESKFDPKFLIEEWKQQIEGDTLEVILNGSNVRMNIEWTNSKEQLVEAKMYKTYSYMGGINMEKEIPLPTLEVKDNQIILTAIPQKERTYYRFTNELTFFSTVNNLDSWEQRRVIGHTYIYLKVPKHINVIDKDGLQFY